MWVHAGGLCSCVQRIKPVAMHALQVLDMMLRAVADFAAAVAAVGCRHQELRQFGNAGGGGGMQK
jgi:hypothetical protein